MYVCTGLGLINLRPAQHFFGMVNINHDIYVSTFDVRRLELDFFVNILCIFKTIDSCVFKMLIFKNKEVLLKLVGGGEGDEQAHENSLFTKTSLLSTKCFFLVSLKIVPL